MVIYKWYFTMAEVIGRALYIVFETICYALCIKDKEEDEKN